MKNIPVKIERLTKEALKGALPERLRKNISDDFVDHVNDVLSKSDIREQLRENILGYLNIMKDGKYKLKDYISAVKYVSYKLFGYTNQESYHRAFPDRYNRLVTTGADEKTISGYVANYNKNKLVNAIYEQTMIPAHILNMEHYQAAVNKQVWLMENANSEKVQTEAANSLLHHLKPPEVANVELNIKTEDSNSITHLREALTNLATTQKELIQQGLKKVEQVAQEPIIVITEEVNNA